jgi:hypothetical protein
VAALTGRGCWQVRCRSAGCSAAVVTAHARSSDPGVIERGARPRADRVARFAIVT